MLSKRFSPAARAALSRARQAAAKHKSGVTGTAHLLLALLEAPFEDEALDRVSTLLLLSGVSREEARLYAEAARGGDEGEAANSHSLALARALDGTLKHTYQESIGPEHLLIALTREQDGPHVGALLRPLGLHSAQLEAHLRQLERDEANPRKPLRMLDARAKIALANAHAAMRANYCGRVSTSHLLLGLLDCSSPILTFLKSRDVDLDELRALAGQGARNDGVFAGPQMQLAPSAKRAIERAKTLALENWQTRIAPEHLWLALLPRAVSWREKSRWGGDLNDPLDEVWKRFDSSILKRALADYLAANKPKSLPMPKVAPQKLSYIHLDWRFVVAGLAWHGWFFAGLDKGFAMMLPAFAVGVMVSIMGSILRWRPLRDGAASWLWGLIVGIGVTWFIGANFG